MFPRDKVEDIEVSKVEVEKLDRVIKDLKLDYEQIQHEITNIKISQTMRRSQIARLSGLSQPVEFDQTYFFANRHPSSSASSVVDSPAAVGTRTGVGTAGAGGAVPTQMLRTGDTVILEARLDNVSKLIQGQFHAFATRLSAINLSEAAAMPPAVSLASLSSSAAPSTSASSSGGSSSGPSSRAAAVTTATAAASSSSKRALLRAEAVAILKELEKAEEQLFATIIELLNLRLRMMIAQREEVEERETFRGEEKEHQQQEASTLLDLNSHLAENKRKFDKDLAHQLHKYQRQLHKSTQKLSVLESSDQRRVVAQQEDDRRLLDRLHAAKTRHDRLCRRHALELEGYASEATALKNKLKYAQRAMKMIV